MEKVQVEIKGWQTLQRAMELDPNFSAKIHAAIKKSIDDIINGNWSKAQTVAGEDIKAGQPVYIRKDGKAYKGAG